jgi:hypothetical protein
LNLRHAEIDYLYPVAAIILADDYIIGFDIAMNDAYLMRGVKRAAYLAQDAGRSLDRESALGAQEFAKRFALNELHHYKGQMTF